MKFRAFLQAVVLVVFLIGSWFLVFFKVSKESPSEIQPSVPFSQGEVQDIQDPQVMPGEVQEPTGPTEAVPPTGWQNWVDYLDSASSPETMRAALDDLEQSLLAIPREDAIRRIVEFLESGSDLKTGLAFQPGPDHSLIGTGSLRAFLLDLLSKLDPGIAAQWAENELTQLGTSLAPDVYAIHLRNYALGTDQQEAARIQFLHDRLQEVLQNEGWTAQPVSAIAEILDVAVYISATDFIPGLSGLMERDDPQILRRAAALAIERLVDAQPVNALREILEQAAWPAGMQKARAGYFARLDPSLEGAEQLLEEYLTSPVVDIEEARFFLLSFPNLNKSFSYNLLSSQTSITPAKQSEMVLEKALDQVRRWKEAPEMEDLEATLHEVEEAILFRIYGRVAP